MRGDAKDVTHVHATEKKRLGLVGGKIIWKKGDRKYTAKDVSCRGQGSKPKVLPGVGSPELRGNRNQRNLG